MRTGILGGTFNPPHLGHLVCAQEAFWQLELEQVVLVPVGEAPHKEIVGDAGREARFELCRLAAEGDERLDVSRAELDREGPSYTVDTLREWRERSPRDELFFIMGGDQAMGLAEWREPERLLELATIAVADREPARRKEIAAKVAGLHRGDRVVFFDMPHIGVSSTMVRQRVAAGLPIRYLVPAAVADYIERSGLYRQGVRA